MCGLPPFEEIQSRYGTRSLRAKFIYIVVSILASGLTLTVREPHITTVELRLFVPLTNSSITSIRFKLQ